MEESFRHLILYHCWANQRLIDHLRTLPKALFLLKMESVFPTLSQTFGHIYSVDQLWLSRISGKNPSQISDHTFQSIEEVEEAFIQQTQAFHQLIGNQPDLLTNIHYKTTKGRPDHQKLYQLLQHLVNHGTYHRGNIAAMVRQLGYHGVSTDYLTFLRTQNSK